MEHVEQAGIHSGDSACSLPPYSLPKRLQDELRRQTTLMAKALDVVGLMNVQFAIQGEGRRRRPSSTCSRSTRARRAPCPSSPRRPAQPLAKIAARCMVGQKLAEPARLVRGEVDSATYFSVKEAVFPFNKFPGVDPILGPEMRSTGEVMGVGPHLRRGDAEEPARRRLAPADQGHGLHHGEERRQAARGRGGARAARARLPAGRDHGHRRGDRRGRRAGARRSTRSRTAGRTSSTWSRRARSSSSSPPSTRPARRSPIRATSARRRWPIASPTTPAWPAARRRSRA